MIDLLIIYATVLLPFHIGLIGLFILVKSIISKRGQNFLASMMLIFFAVALGLYAIADPTIDASGVINSSYWMVTLGIGFLIEAVIIWLGSIYLFRKVDRTQILALIAASVLLGLAAIMLGTAIEYIGFQILP
jgi:hypothetical protein